MTSSTARSIVLVFMVAGLAAGLQVGCSHTDTSEIATVGDETITVRDFLKFMEQNRIGFRSAEEEFEGKRMFLDSLISHTLLVQAAYDKHIDQSPEVARIVEANRSRFLLDALYEIHVSSMVSVSEAEIREVYADLEFQVRAFHILLDNEDTANMVFEKVKAGENFEQLAYQYSLDARAKRNRGDMGYFVRGSAPEEFERVVFGLEIGEITPPFKTSFGYHLVKVVDKKLNDLREEFARMRPTLEQQLLLSKRQTLTNVYFDSVKAKYPITVDRDVADYITHKRTVLYPPPVVEKLPKYDFDEEMLDRDEKELALATWNGGQITLIDYLLSVRKFLPAEQRPTFEEYELLEETIYGLKRMDILAYEAEVQGTWETEVFKRNFELFKRYTLAEIMRNDSIPVPQAPTEQEQRDYYDQHREEYLVPAQVHMFEIMVGDEMLAQKLAREINTIEEFQARAFQLTERAALRVKRGDLGYCDSIHFPILFPAARRVPVGTIGGPIRNRGKYSIIWPVRWTEEAYQDFLVVKEDIAARLAGEDKERAVREWIEERRAVTDVDVDDDAIWSTIDKELYAGGGSSTTSP